MKAHALTNISYSKLRALTLCSTDGAHVWKFYVVRCVFSALKKKLNAASSYMMKTFKTEEDAVSYLQEKNIISKRKLNDIAFWLAHISEAQEVWKLICLRNYSNKMQSNLLCTYVCRFVCLTRL